MDITHEEFTAKMNGFEKRLGVLFEVGRKLEKEIQDGLKELEFDIE